VQARALKPSEKPFLTVPPQPNCSAGDPGLRFCIALSDKLKFVGR
jgi:hypothetical protein